MNQRKTLSFYRYTPIVDPVAFKQQLQSEWLDFQVLGRCYLSTEGINAQVSVPLSLQTAFEAAVREHFPGIAFKRALEENMISFQKLKIKVRTKIVADGLDDTSFDVADVGRHLSAKEFHEAMNSEKTVVVDMRNHYECEVGHFDGAYLPKANTFREALPEVTEFLQDKKEHKILLYCTGGIRCEKASSWLRHQGFQDVNQLHGGIIDYAQQIQQEGLESRYKGMNFVFDDRLGERVTEDVIATCHQCQKPWDLHSNCQNPGCNLLFLQCPDCAEEFDSCCSYQCRDIYRLPKEEQVRWQNEKEKSSPKFLRSRQRPDLIALKHEYVNQRENQQRFS
ncbi:MAG: rhodanese-related sulfurtransferase [Oligoflexus sp.]